jgi:photosystem II stability/assembly factor-like uncharacterized protein
MPHPLSNDAAMALTLAMALAVAWPAAAGPASENYLRTMQEDAELLDLFFLDAQRGWAVGERGAIWGTLDGGKHWRLLPSGVTCRLSSVQFLDAENGWAAGGSFHPYTHTSRGVLLRTRDGGRTWAQDKGLMLPALRRLKFFTGQMGWAFGEASALFPSGAFATDDGGRTWTPLTGLDGGGWLAGDFVDNHTGAMSGRSGTLAVVRRRGLAASRTAPFALRGLNRLQLSGETGGWLVGDGGLVLSTADLGTSWQLPPGDSGQATGGDFDWRALDVRGSRVWIAGSPGTKVLTSADGGQTWQAFATGQHPPLNAIAFADDLHGWAVGALGTILATTDGGKTWRRQRAGGTRAALIGFYSGPDAVPFELFARLSGNDGYLGVVELIGRRDQEPGRPDFMTLADRAREALVAVGASSARTAWRFPTRPAGVALTAEQMVESWNQANDGEGVERLEAHLVRQVRCWRPEIVLTHAASPRGDDPLGHVMNQIVIRAVEQAADPTCFPEQLAEMGLGVWRVRKVLGSLPDGQLGELNLASAQLATRLGASLADFVAEPRGLIADGFVASPVNLGARVYVDTLPQHVGERDFFSGITLPPGGDARRNLAEFSMQGADLVRRNAQKHRNMQAIIARSEQHEYDPARFLAQIGDMTSGLDGATAGNVVYQLADRYRRTGRWAMAAEAFTVLAEQYPDHPLSEAALVWLVRYWSSGEVAWRARRVAHDQVRLAAASQVADQISVVQPAVARGGTSSADRAVPVPGAPGPVQGNVLAFDNTVPDDWPEQASRLGKLLERRSPAVYAEPMVRFPLAAAHRKQGFPRQAERYYLDVTHTRADDAWRACAAGEEWLLGPREGLPPKNMLRAPTGARPRLDGQLDDPLWHGAKAVELRVEPISFTGKPALAGEGADKDWPATAMIAYDNEFLYLAVECRQAPGCQYPAGEGPRPRDPDLTTHDRVEFYLDLDRDWATWYRLTIDHRGWTGESCWSDDTWNPQWFVAAHTEDGVWRAEAAIALAELTGEPPRPHEVWAVGIQRVVPGVGFQSWTAPASTAVAPEGFGYLLFE